MPVQIVILSLLLPILVQERSSQPAFKPGVHVVEVDVVVTDGT